MPSISIPRVPGSGRLEAYPTLEQLFDRLAAGEDGDGAAGIVEVLLLGVDAEMVVDGGQHVERRFGVVFRERPVAVGSPDDAPPFDFAAGNRRTEHVRIMVAAGVVV